MGQCIPRTANQILGLLQIKLKGNGEGNRRLFGWVILDVVDDLGEKLFIDVCLLVDLRILLSAMFDQVYESNGKTGILLFQELGQVIRRTNFGGSTNSLWCAYIERR